MMHHQSQHELVAHVSAPNENSMHATGMLGLKYYSFYVKKKCLSGQYGALCFAEYFNSKMPMMMMD
jgi:hypothetical protein